MEKVFLNFAAKMATPKMSAIPPKLLRLFDVNCTKYDDNLCYFLNPKKQKPTNYLIYLHGGAYFLQINKVQ